MNRQRTLALVLSAALVVGSPVAAQTRSPAPTLDIYVTDTEGGKATLFVSPSGETVLIDTGKPGDRDLNRIMQVLGPPASTDQAPPPTGDPSARKP